MLRAVLWDMGGPIDQEIEYERLIDEDMKRDLTQAGVHPVGRRLPRGWTLGRGFICLERLQGDGVEAQLIPG